MIHPIYLLILSFLPAIYLAIKSPGFFRQISLDIRLGRITHYFILFLFGFTLYHHSIKALQAVLLNEWMVVILFFMILMYAALYAIATNNIEDIEIDKVSNKERPLVQETIDPSLYMLTAKLSLLFSFSLALLIEWVYFISVLGISIIYFIYSCKPFKFKRFVLIAKLLIGINSFISAICGFVIAGGAWNEFPIFWSIFILIPVSLMANFVDLKDTLGDRIAGIKTLPVLLGEGVTKKLIGGFILLTYSMVLFYFDHIYLKFIIILSCSFHLFLLFKKPYKEKYLFWLHNFLFLGLISLILIQDYFEL
jgi:4-hydroxybenzoate polyprenyltransferase